MLYTLPGFPKVPVLTVVLMRTNIHASFIRLCSISVKRIRGKVDINVP